MDEQERKQTLELLERTRKEYVSAVAGLTDEEARWKPAPDRWSALECTEHVALAEGRMLRLIREKAAPNSKPIQPGREAQILSTGADRTQKRVAPEGARPAGRYATLAEALRAFEQGRDATIAYIAQEPRDLRAVDVEHALLGWITAQECLALLTIHPARHAAQVRELREHPRFNR